MRPPSDGLSGDRGVEVRSEPGGLFGGFLRRSAACTFSSSSGGGTIGTKGNQGVRTDGEANSRC